jgi:hypothetical protein
MLGFPFEESPLLIEDKQVKGSYREACGVEKAVSRKIAYPEYI